MYRSCIGHVLAVLTCIVHESSARQERSRIGYVSCMYRTGQIGRVENAHVLTRIVHVSKRSNRACSERAHVLTCTCIVHVSKRQNRACSERSYIEAYRKGQIARACIRTYRDVSKTTIWPHVSNTWARREIDTRLRNRRNTWNTCTIQGPKKWRRGTTQYMPKRGKYRTVHASGENPTLYWGEIPRIPIRRLWECICGASRLG